MTSSSSLLLKHLVFQLNSSRLSNSFFKKSLISTDNLDFLQDTALKNFKENFYENKLELIPYNVSIQPNLIIFNKDVERLSSTYTSTTHVYINNQACFPPHLFIFYRFFICLHINNAAAN